jgi:hypothetical protein
MFTTIVAYEPLRNIAILTVATVASAQWMLRDTLSVAFSGGTEQMRKAYLKIRGIPDYDGRHRA